MDASLGSGARGFLPVENRLASARRSKLATVAMVLGIVGAATSFIGVGILPGVVAVVCSLVASARIRRRPHVIFGDRQANWGGVLGCVACAAAVIVIMQSNVPHRGISTRTYCMANLRGIASSMNVYATENDDAFPVLPYAPYSVANGSPSLDMTPVSNTIPISGNAIWSSTGTLAGSPMANMWLLVNYNYVTPKQFICKSDPFVNAAALVEASGSVYLNFQRADQLSYAFAYPYTKEGKVGAWWKDGGDGTVPIASDMPPVNGTGSPPRNVTPGALPTDLKVWNSANHDFEGQAVAFNDGHAEFVRRPDVGQSNDNMFTYTGRKSVSQFGGMQPGFSAIEIGTDVPPYDIVVVPARNLNTGGF